MKPLKGRGSSMSYGFFVWGRGEKIMVPCQFFYIMGTVHGLVWWYAVHRLP